MRILMSEESKKTKRNKGWLEFYNPILIILLHSLQYMK